MEGSDQYKGDEPAPSLVICTMPCDINAGQTPTTGSFSNNHEVNR